MDRQTTPASRPGPSKQFSHKPFQTTQLTALAYETIQREMAELREENRLLKTENANLKYEAMTSKSAVTQGSST
jgi:hypothetical protein